MAFSFQPKTESLNWDQMASVDVTRVAQQTDIATLEQLLQNLSNARLTGDDLRKIGDRNYIKLFKIGQLQLEYLLFQQAQAEFQLSASIREQGMQKASCLKLQEKVKDK